MVLSLKAPSNTFNSGSPVSSLILALGWTLLIHYLLFRAAQNVEKTPIRGGITMLIYGIFWTFSILSLNLIGVLVGMVLVIAAFLALVNVQTHRNPHQAYPGSFINMGYNSWSNNSPETYRGDFTNTGEPIASTNNPNPFAPTRIVSTWPSPNGFVPDTSTPFSPFTPLPTVADALSLVGAGKKAEAYTIFKVLVSHYPDQVNLWLWLAFTTNDLQEAQRAIFAASTLGPGLPEITQAQNWLAQELRKATL